MPTSLMAAVVLVAACGTSTAPSSEASLSAAPSPTATATGTPGASVSPIPSPSAVLTGRWEDAGRMASPRIAPRTSLLGDGRVLVVGGDESSTVAEVWDPAAITWTRAGTLNKARRGFLAAPLADGRVLVAGGSNDDGTSFSSSYVFDPAAGTWTKSGLLSTARSEPSAATLPDGRILVVGGWFHDGTASSGGLVLAAWHEGAGHGPAALDDVEPEPQGPAMATAEVFDPQQGRWFSTGAMHWARFGAATVELADGRVLVAGSLDGSANGVQVPEAAATNAEVFDPANETFTDAGRFPAIDGAALQAQGEPGANPVPTSEPSVEAVGTLVALDDGGAVLIGHAQSWKHEGEITRSFRYDAAANTWSELPGTYVLVGEPTAKLLFATGVPNHIGAMAARLPDGSVLVAGGLGPVETDGQGWQSKTTASAWRLDPATGTWSDLPRMPEARRDGAVQVLRDGGILVAGGWGPETADGSSSDLASAVRFVIDH